MPEHPNMTIARELATPISSGDAETIHRHLTDNVIWHTADHNWNAGDYQGCDPVVMLLTAMAVYAKRSLA